jgi:hypothetical protein
MCGADQEVSRRLAWQLISVNRRFMRNDVARCELMFYEKVATSKAIGEITEA